MSERLTDRQAEVLGWIRVFIRQRGFSPTYREIARGVGLASTSSVARYIHILEAKGYLRREFHAERAIRPYRTPMELLVDFAEVLEHQPLPKDAQEVNRQLREFGYDPDVMSERIAAAVRQATALMDGNRR